MITQEMRMFETRNDLNLNSRQEMISVLNAQLADTFNMFSFMKHAHWNVIGPEFIAVHKMIGSRRFTLASEAMLRGLGLNRAFGSPITVVAERCAAS